MLWCNADWNAMENRLFEMQKCIALAAKSGDFNSVRMYQKRLTSDLDAKMIAVRCVAKNCSMPGIDGDGNVVHSCPSNMSILKMESDLKEIILKFTGSQKSLIDKLNKKLYGWATYHRITDARKAFHYIDAFVRCLLLKLCHQLHPKWSRKKILDQYFFLNHKGEHIYALHDKKDEQVISLADTALIEYIPHKISNQFLESTNSNLEERKIYNIVGKYKSIWERQSGKCYFCGRDILQDQQKIIVHKLASKIRSVKNLAYAHADCVQHETEFIRTNNLEFSHESIPDIVKGFYEKRRAHKFRKLMEYFRTLTQSSVTLSFHDISKVIGTDLCSAAYKSTGYWSQNSYGTIGYSWTSNGYKITNIDMKKRRICFTRDRRFISIKIPEIFIDGQIPHNAKAELESFFDYIMKKYAL